jgi:pimeloyl-ACP methyl ester carboxylesterase
MELFSRVIGSGQPLIIIHGLFGMSDNWQSLAKQFSAFFEVHLIDQRNHGRSFHNDQFNYQNLSEDLWNYIESKQLDEVIILGHSLGGKTAMEFATANPSMVKKLIVVDISPKFYPIHHHTILEGLRFLSKHELTSRKVADQLLSEFIHQSDVRQFLLKSLYWNEDRKLEFRFNLNGIANNIENVGQALGKQSFYDGPSLFLQGGDSDYINSEDEDLIFHHFSNAQIETIDDAGHWLHAQKPQVFFDLVSRFCI